MGQSSDAAGGVAFHLAEAPPHATHIRQRQTRAAVDASAGPPPPPGQRLPAVQKTACLPPPEPGAAGPRFCCRNMAARIALKADTRTGKITRPSPAIRPGFAGGAIGNIRTCRP